MKNTHKILTADFFNRDTKLVAKELLGKVLYRQTNNVIFKAVISETEAYHGIDDLACHCSKGITPRTEIMYGKPGHVYIYLIYGMYHMLNFVTMPKDFPAAVLIRGIQNLEISYNKEKSFEKVNAKTDGPGKLTRQLQIDKTLNQLLLHTQSGLWVAEENIIITDANIGTGKRIGVDYAKEWADKPWRYFIKKDCQK